ncbi:Crp/Fnr family transcriptional regulator [Ferrovibrio xuzhouensis]|uniref:Crp/Fnr family transcriptional regulator n=1 Tax=Ferrovibrio xuzhouensis TaxID=1576914 RepID=A0ABV7VED7_9PROT
MALAQAFSQTATRMPILPPGGFPSRHPAGMRGQEINQPGAKVVSLPGMSDALQRIGQPLVMPRNRVVHEAGDPASQIYKVVDGTLRVVQLLPDGRRHVISFLHAGDYFGLDENGEYVSTVEAVTDCSLTRYPRRQFDAVLDADASAGRQIFRLMCHQLTTSNRMLLLLGRKTAAERMASFLLDIVGHSMPCGEANHVTVSLPMSRGDIADHLGLTVETVSRLVTKFRQHKLIRLASAHEMIIPDIEALRDMAGD